MLNEVTKLAELPECSKYFLNSPQLVKNSTIFRIILNEVTKLAELLEHSKYFFRLPTTCKKFYKLIKES